MEKKKEQAFALMDSIADDLVLCYKRGDKYGSRDNWCQLAGAARMYANAFGISNPNPIQTVALEVLRVVCETHGKDLIDVMNFIRY